MPAVLFSPKASESRNRTTSHRFPWITHTAAGRPPSSGIVADSVWIAFINRSTASIFSVAVRALPQPSMNALNAGVA